MDDVRATAMNNGSITVTVSGGVLPYIFKLTVLE
ncbi:MAG: hypothetical protein R2795_19510 [Saprospiraceae bacterium]